MKQLLVLALFLAAGTAHADYPPIRANTYPPTGLAMLPPAGIALPYPPTGAVLPPAGGDKLNVFPPAGA
jgi:hypothetical protein